MLTLSPHRPRDGGGFQVLFEGGNAVLQPGMAPDVLDLIWLGIDAPEARGKGLGQAVLAALAKRFPRKKIKPWSVAPEAARFWDKMAARGYCLAP